MNVDNGADLMSLLILVCSSASQMTVNESYFFLFLKNLIAFCHVITKCVHLFLVIINFIGSLYCVYSWL